MEHRRHILPSNYLSQHQALDSSRPRQALTDATGNAQYHTLASTGLHYDQKSHHVRMDQPPPRFSLPTLPSQHQQGVASQLELRRSQTRRNRAHRSRNPIVESQHYLAYRSRQLKDSDGDQKWSTELEESFLDALLEIPKMGRRKYSLNGKPHGRNELISLYLWIAYCESLPPGVKPDVSKQRTRKQVSSHIQVLKGFMRGHPAYDRLFPSRDAPKNGFEDSFKNDPCLRALAAGRLPHKRQPYDFVPSMGQQAPHNPIRPRFFEMCMTVPRPANDYTPPGTEDVHDDKVLKLEHRYSGPNLKSMARENLETIPNWRSRFPLLARAQPIDPKCDIIHMEVSLSIRNGRMPEAAELWGHFEIIIPGEEEVRANWRCIQSLYKPNDLYGPAESDRRYENVDSVVAAERYEPGVGTHMRVSFPANTWAYALVKIAELEEQFEEANQTGKPFPTTMSARKYIDQINMYQEIFCAVGHDPEYKRKAIIVWTFKKSGAGEKGEAAWRFLDPSPPRRACFSPHPGQGHVVSAAMAENFNAWAEPPQMHIQTPGPYDPLLQGLQTPPQSAVLHSPFGYNNYPAPHQDMPGENLSFMSHETDTTDSTLVDPPPNFLGPNGQVSLDFEQTQNMWAAPPIESFDSDNQFLVNYSSVQQPVQGQVWDGSESKQHQWEGADLGFAGYEAHMGTRLK